MTKLLVRAPIRADLAGGTLDLWPLSVFHPGARTINVAISRHVECEITTISDSTIEIALLDTDYRQSYDSLTEVSKDPAVRLVFIALDHFRTTGVRIATRSEAPRGSGLGASSALAICLVRGLSEIAGFPLEGEQLIHTVRDLETRMLGVPAGVQDYYPPVFGGLATLRLEPGGVSRTALNYPLGELGRSLIVHYSGVSHFSGTNNWEIYKRHIDGDQEVIDGLGKIAATAQAMDRAFENQDLETVGRLLSEEWDNRRNLFEGVSTPEVDRIISIGLKAGALGAKVCGAGGGGCIVMIVDPDRRAKVVKALTRAPGETLDVVPVPYGLELISPDDSLASRPRKSWSIRPGGETVDELWYTGGGEDAIHPAALVDARVVFDESRKGLMHSIARTWLVPIDENRESLVWEQARRRADRGDLTSSQGSSPDARTVRAAHRAVSDIEAKAREMVLERSRLPLFYNPELDLFSEPEESREEFQARCLDLVTASRQDDLSRLEATLRLRIDQVRERYDRERETEDAELAESERTKRRAAFPWGQIIQDILQGRKPTRVKGDHLETDAWDKLMQHERTFRREHEELMDEVARKVRTIEEVSLQADPGATRIERVAIVWMDEDDLEVARGS